MRFLLVTLLALALSGCATLGYEKAKTFNDGVIYARANLESAALTTGNLVQSGTLAPVDRDWIVKKIEEGQKLLDDAEKAYAAKNTAGANDKLAQAKAVLIFVKGWLKERGGVVKDPTTSQLDFILMREEA